MAARRCHPTQPIPVISSAKTSQTPNAVRPAYLTVWQPPNEALSKAFTLCIFCALAAPVTDPAQLGAAQAPDSPVSWWGLQCPSPAQPSSMKSRAPSRPCEEESKWNTSWGPALEVRCSMHVMCQAATGHWQWLPAWPARSRMSLRKQAARPSLLSTNRKWSWRAGSGWMAQDLLSRRLEWVGHPCWKGACCGRCS